MKTRTQLIILAAVLLMGVVVGQNWVGAADSGLSDKLAVVWTSGDPEVAHRMVLMYTQAAKNAGWFDDVTLIVWGPSSRLLAADKDIQAKVKSMMESGVEVHACVACANSYGVADTLRALGVTVEGMGKPLSDLVKSDWKVLTF